MLPGNGVKPQIGGVKNSMLFIYSSKIFTKTLWQFHINHHCSMSVILFAPIEIVSTFWCNTKSKILRKAPCWVLALLPPAASHSPLVPHPVRQGPNLWRSDTGDICRMQWLQPSPRLHEAVYLTHHAPCLLIAWKCVNIVWISWIVHLSLVRKSLWINLSTMHWDLTSERIRSISKCAWLSEVWPKNWSFRSCGPTQRCCLSIWAGHTNHKLRQTRLT